MRRKRLVRDMKSTYNVLTFPRPHRETKRLPFNSFPFLLFILSGVVYGYRGAWGGVCVCFEGTLNLRVHRDLGLCGFKVRELDLRFAVLRDRDDLISAVVTRGLESVCTRDFSIDVRAQVTSQ